MTLVQTAQDRPIQRAARAAGLLYLLAGLSGGFGIMYVPTALVVAGDASATAANIVASEALVRLGIAAELLSGVAFLFLARALYRLLRGVSEKRASLMATLLEVSAVLGLVNVLPELAALTLAKGAAYLTVFPGAQSDALAMLFLELHRYGYMIDQVFWGLWLLPFGLLVLTSGLFPRVLGVLLIANGCAYLALSATSLLAPDYAGAVAVIAMLPMTAGELSIIAWLLLKGARVPGPEPAAA